MKSLSRLLDRNRRWAEGMSKRDPKFFGTLAKQQTPKFLWIGCSDSRVPANQIVDLLPGEIFVHRNVANVVVNSDLNCLSVIQYAVDVLKVEHIIVCGHYGCGGVQAAFRNQNLGLITNWLRHVRDVSRLHKTILNELPSEAAREDKLCELNVIEQAVNVCRSTVVQSAWERGQDVTVHSLIYRLTDGLLRDLGMTVSEAEALQEVYGSVLEGVGTEPRLLASNE